jgi:preprotein translocase subunit YajC
MSFFISEAWADGAAGAAAQPQGGGYMTLVMFGVLIAMMYFMIWRPQSKRMKEHRELVGGLAKGDEVMVNGAILGRITKVTEDYVAVEIADGVEIKVAKASVTASLPKGTIKQIKDSA